MAQNATTAIVTAKYSSNYFSVRNSNETKAVISFEIQLDSILVVIFAKT